MTNAPETTNDTDDCDTLTDLRIPDAFIMGYIDCMLWSTTDLSRDDGGDPLDATYTRSDISPAFLKQIVIDCDSFRLANADRLDMCYSAVYTESTAGHDFWLTRNCHGAGFWDRDLGDIGNLLTSSARVYGQVSPFVGDDGLIYG